MSFLPQDAVVWGHETLPGALAGLGLQGVERPLLMTIRRLGPMQSTNVLPHVRDLAGTFDALPAHVPDYAVEAAYAAAVSSKAGSILAHGGGSVLDAAKAVSHLHFQRQGTFLPIAALPTTLSGSEFSHYFGISETTGPQTFKRSYAVRETVPRLVVLDPVLLHDTPRDLLLASCIKSIDHAVEGMRRVGTDHPHAVMAQRGVASFMATLPKAAPGMPLLTDADLLTLQLASWQCYFAPAAVKYGLSHRIGHVLGGSFGVPHSVTSCITLAPVIRQCAALYAGRLEVFVPDAAPGSAAAALADSIAALVTLVGLPSRLQGFGPVKASLPDIAALLRQHYPDEVGDLCPGEPDRLEALLAGFWD